MAKGRPSVLLFLFSLTFLLVHTLPYEPNAKYNGWQVKQVRLDDGSPEALVQEFYDLEDPNLLQVLRVSRVQDETDFGLAEIAVAPTYEEEFTNALTAKGLNYTTAITDLATKLSMDEPSLRRADLLRGVATFERFMSFEEIQAHVEELPNQYPGQVKVRELDRTTENRPIYLVTIHSGSSKKSPVIFVDGGMHAREWASPAAALFLVGHLLESPALTRDVEWRIVPVLNPDGYVYSWTTDRMWRKNRGATRSLLCTGVDINRNFDYHWGESGSSKQPCSSIYQGMTPSSEPETNALISAVLEVKRRVKAYVSLHAYGQYILYPWGYRRTTPKNSAELSGSSKQPCSSIYQGMTPSSEPETNALISAVLEVKRRVKAYVSLHAYGQYILYPWGYRRTTPKNSAELEEVGQGMAEAIRKAQGKVFAVGSSAKLLYPAAGASDDWALGVAKVPLSYTLELRDEGAAGFVLPPNQIIPAANEAWAAMKYLGEYVAKQEAPRQEALVRDGGFAAPAVEQSGAPGIRTADPMLPMFLDGFADRDDSESNESDSTEESFSDEAF
ncbi:carboxypeptidase B1-like [Penaeus indicus]|uniref:carboxypeptidase B1-like n=1 Tax=Penaeus indicus TaxID=29960 RepID=UPI00300D4589